MNFFKFTAAMILGLGLSSASAFAQRTNQEIQPNQATQPSKSKGEERHQLTPEQREKMAVAHEKMAACLRSTKTLSECREEMKKQCKGMMGKGSYPMMEHEEMEELEIE